MAHNSNKRQKQSKRSTRQQANQHHRDRINTDQYADRTVQKNNNLKVKLSQAEAQQEQLQHDADEAWRHYNEAAARAQEAELRATEAETKLRAYEQGKHLISAAEIADLTAEANFLALTVHARRQIQQFDNTLSQIIAPLGSEIPRFHELIWAFVVRYQPLIDDGTLEQLYRLHELQTTHSRDANQHTLIEREKKSLQQQLTARAEQEFRAEDGQTAWTAEDDAEFYQLAFRLFSLLDRLDLPPEDSGRTPSRGTPFHLVGERYGLLLAARTYRAQIHEDPLMPILLCSPL